MDIKAILEKYFKDVTLTEDVKTELETIWTTAITEAVNQKIEEVKKETEERLEEQCRVDLNEFKETLVDNLNKYLDYAVDEFVKENELAEISKVKVEMAESTMKGLLDIIGGHYIKIDETKIDVVKDLEAKVESLTAKLDEQTDSLLEERQQVFEYEKALSFKRLCEGLSDNESDKLLSLVEDVHADDIESFEKKLTIIKEKFVKSSGNKEEETLNEDIDETIDKNLDHLKKYLPKAY